MNFPARTLALVAAAAVALGCALRVAWPQEIEYKADEKFMLARALRAGTSEPWPAVGMPSGAGGVPNPGLSVWVFAGLAKITGARTPVGLARCVQVLNCGALLALAVFAFRQPEPDRRVWLWALALAALSPTAILVQRKIWAQSVLPLLCVFLLLAWWRRRSFFGALLWSALALLAAQIHMSGFFFFAALTLWTLLFWRDSMHWRGWAAGIALGGLSALPWLRAVLFAPLPAGVHAPRWLHLFGPEFWRLWVTDGFGLGLEHNLGGDLPAFLRGPSIGGRETWLVGVALAALALLLIWFVTRFVFSLWRGRREWRARFSECWGISRESSHLLNAGFVAYGVLLSLPALGLYRHYLLIAFPLTYLWLAAIALAPASLNSSRNEKLLVVALALNLFVSVELFSFLRANGGAPHGDFGVSWRAQGAAPRAEK
ncbi:MAG TPA: hypothetical protein VHD62_02580 [Opitutaceae bacterium]|nr:hypothetical protein [Opitutaceae bacterium]